MRAMSSGPKFFEEFAKLANGAAGAFSGMKEEMEALARQQIERFLAEMDMVPREEFDAVKDMAAKARGEQEKLKKRVAKLEARLKAKPAAKKPPARKPPAKKPAPRKPR